jgi:predicted DNA-binding transcriptional regulator AlpA
MNYDLPQLLNEKAVAQSLRVSVVTVRRWRALKAGPRYTKLGKAVRYRVEDVHAFVEGGIQA